LCLYQKVISLALNTIVTAELNAPDAIWKEHVRSEITRTVIECCYPHVLKAARAGGQDGRAGKVMIVLPAEEYHELGARMGADFFLINGFDALFVGSNTPREEVISGIAHFKPDFIDIHVVNYYNLFKAKALIQQIRDLDPRVKILASGYAFCQDPGLSAQIGQVCLIQSFDDIASLREGLA
jgi:methanogenic corrinoid protein MtbC1